MAAVANVAINVDSRGANDKLRQLQAQSKKTEGSFQKLGAVAAKLGGALALLGAAKFVFAKTAELESQRRSLEVLTGSAEQAGKIIKDLQSIGKVTPFTSTELIETAKRLNAFGVEAENVVETTKRLADVSGATGAELSGLATAYGQVQAKGRLQGEELLQFQERGVALQQELRKMYQLSGEEFQDALSKGKIGAEAVEVAIKRLTNAGGKYADGAVAQSDTLNGRFSTLVDNVETLARTLGEVLLPMLKKILGTANQALSAINRVLTSEISRDLSLGRGALITPGGTLGDLESLRQTVEGINAATIGDESLVVTLSNELKALDQQQRAVARDINRRRAFGITDEEQAAFEALTGAIMRQINALGARQKALQQGAAPAEVLEIPELSSGTRGSTGKKAKTLKGQKDMSMAMLALLQKRRSIEFSLDEFGKADLERQIEIQRIMESSMGPRRRIDALERANLDHQKKYNAEFKKRADALAEVVKASEKLAEDVAGKEIAKQNRIIEQQAQRMKQFYASIGDSITTGIVDSLSAAVDGTKSLAEVAQSTLRSVANILLKFGLSNVLGGLGGNDDQGVFSMLFGGRRAGGGPVSAGRPYMVGESGPEMFVPSGKGSIVANKDLGGGTVINITNNIAEGGAQTNARGEGQSAAAMNQLSKMMVAVIQREQRPGGVLSRR